MGESSGPIAVVLPSYPGGAAALLALASAIASRRPGAESGHVLALHDERGSGHDMVRRLSARPDVELRASGGDWHERLAAIRDAHAGFLLLDWEDWTGPGDVPRRQTTAMLAQHAPCHVAIVKRAGFGDVRQILLPVRGGPQGLLTLRLAMTLAERYDASITLLHVEQPGLRPADDAAVRAQLDALLAGGAQPTRAQPAIVIAGSVESAITAEAEEHQVTIMGASPGDPGTPLLLGPVAEAVAERGPGTLIIVKARE